MGGMLKMNDKKELPSLDELDAKIKKAKSQKRTDSGSHKQLSSTRVSVELFSGVLVGAGLGYYIDKWLDTLPVFMIILFFFGVAAGALNIYKLTTRNIDEDDN